MVKALEKDPYSTHVRQSPRTWGTRPGGKAWWEAGKAEEEMTANTPNRSKVVHCSLNLTQASRLLGITKGGLRFHAMLSLMDG